MKNFLLVSAAAFEIAPLIARLRRNRNFESRGFDFIAAETGVGALAAAATAQGLGVLAQNRHVIFVGTAGIFSGFDDLKGSEALAAPTLCTASLVAWLPTCERLGLGYGIPRGTIHQITVPPAQHAALKLPALRVLCSPSISLEAGFSKNLAATFDPVTTLENLELFSCIKPLLAFGKSVDIVLGVTNAIGPDAHEQWKKNHKPAAELAAEHIERNLSDL